MVSLSTQVVSVVFNCAQHNLETILCHIFCETSARYKKCNVVNLILTCVYHIVLTQCDFTLSPPSALTQAMWISVLSCNKKYFESFALK